VDVRNLRAVVLRVAHERTDRMYTVDTITLSTASSLRFLRNARVTRGYDFRSRQKRPVPLVAYRVT